MKLISVFIIALLVMFTSGCLDEASSSSTQEECKLQYNLEENAIYTYKVLSMIEKPYQEVTENTRISVSDITNEQMNLEIVVETKANDASSTGTYYLGMTDFGNIIDRVSSDMLVIPEMQIGSLPFLEYPDEDISMGKSWNSSYNRDDTYFTSDNQINYTIVGNTTYTCVGFEEVSLNGDDIYCVDISAKTNYVLEMSSTFDNNTVSLRTICNSTGSNLVDLDSGLVVKSEYDLDKETITDYSGVYNVIGIESAYRKTPQKSHVTSELLSIERS